MLVIEKTKSKQEDYNLIMLMVEFLGQYKIMSRNYFNKYSRGSSLYKFMKWTIMSVGFML